MEGCLQEGASPIRYVSLGVFLFGFWIALSGTYTPMLLAIGAASTLACLWVASRIRIVDREGHPIWLLPRTLLYYPWLFKEIVRTGWKVTRIILDPRLPISPTMTVVRANQKTPAGVATYANSITLTVGAVPARISGREFTIHTLQREVAIELEEGEMDRRVTRFEGAG